MPRRTRSLTLLLVVAAVTGCAGSGGAPGAAGEPPAADAGRSAAPCPAAPSAEPPAASLTASPPASPATPGPASPAVPSAGATSPAAAPAGWAAPLPPSLPRPAGARLLTRSRSADGSVLVTFGTTGEFAATAGYLRTALPVAGYTLVGGALVGGRVDADVVEQRFRGAGIRALLRGRRVGACAGAWAIAAVPAGAASDPHLPDGQPAPGGGSASLAGSPSASPSPSPSGRS